MNRFAWNVLLLLGLSSPASAADPVTALRFASSARVEVDAGGKAHVVEMGEVTKLGEVPSLKPIANDINARLRETIESWQFVPAMRDGVAVPSQTSVSVSLEGYDDGKGGLAVRIRNASTGAGLRPIDKTPLSIAVTIAQTEGFVKLRLVYDKDGHVVDAQIKDSKELWHGEYSGIADKRLQKSALAAARKWHLEPEVVDGEAQAGSGTISLVFCLTEKCGETPLPHDPQEGTDPQRFAALDPAVKLRTAVAGTAL